MSFVKVKPTTPVWRFEQEGRGWISVVGDGGGGREGAENEWTSHDELDWIAETENEQRQDERSK